MTHMGQVIAALEFGTCTAEITTSGQPAETFAAATGGLQAKCRLGSAGTSLSFGTAHSHSEKKCKACKATESLNLQQMLCKLQTAS